MTTQRLSYVDLTIIVLLTILGVIPRTLHINESLWVDELHTSWVVSGSWDSVINRATIGNQSPIYFALTKSICGFLGQSELTLRLLSVCLSVATIPLAAAVVWRWSHSRSAAILSGALIALDPEFAYFGTEARPYALVQFVGLIQLFFFVELSIARLAPDGEDRTKRQSNAVLFRLAWLTTSVILFYAHYTAILLVLSQLALSLCVGDRARLRQRAMSTLVDGAALVLLLLPAAGHILAITTRKSNWEAFVFALPVIDAFNSMGLARFIDCYFAIPVSLACLSISVVWIAMPKMLPSKEHIRLVMLVCGCFLIPIGVAWFLTATGVYAVFHLRYLLLPALAGALFAALSVSATRLGVLRCTVSLAIFITVGMYGSYWKLATSDRSAIYTSRGENWRQAVAWIEQGAESRSTDVVKVFPDLIEDKMLADQTSRDEWREYCKFPLTGLYQLPHEKGVVTAGPTRAKPHFNEEWCQSVEAAPSVKRLWLIVRGSSREIEDILDEWFDHGSSMQISSRSNLRYFGRIGVLKIELAR